MPNKLIKILLLIIFIQIFCCTLFLIPVEVNAVDSYKFQVPIGGLDKITFEKDGTTKPIADYIQAIYKYAIGAIAILATVVMMIGGVVWITAAGSQTRIGEAKQYISGALTGMVLVFCSYMILNTINPDLVKFKPVGIETVNKIVTGCCEWSESAPNITTKEECESGEYGEEIGTFIGEKYYPGVTSCVAYALNGNECSDSKKCEPSLQCINVKLTIASTDDYRCTDGKDGSPCHERSDCTCGNPTCDNKKCVCY